jgi:hypothetical protein
MQRKILSIRRYAFMFKINRSVDVGLACPENRPVFRKFPMKTTQNPKNTTYFSRHPEVLYWEIPVITNHIPQKTN